MSSLGIERANGHLFARVFLFFPVLFSFSHVAACSPTCFSLLDSRKSI